MVIFFCRKAGREIDTSDQTVIPCLWASSIGLHLINFRSSEQCTVVQLWLKPIFFRAIFKFLRTTLQFITLKKSQISKKADRFWDFLEMFRFLNTQAVVLRKCSLFFCDFFQIVPIFKSSSAAPLPSLKSQVLWTPILLLTKYFSEMDFKSPMTNVHCHISIAVKLQFSLMQQFLQLSNSHFDTFYK